MKFFRILCIASSILPFRVHGQSYFNIRQDFFQSWGDYSWSVYADTSSIWVSFGTYYNGGLVGPSGGGLAKLDYVGSVIDTTFVTVMHHNVYMGGTGNLNPLNDGFIVGGSLGDSLGIGDAMLMRFDSAGDTLWTRTYGDSGFQSGWMAKPSSDGGFLLCGQSKSDALLMKTDSLGNLLWWRTYGDTVHAELAFSFTETADGGYALAGEKKFGVSSHDFWVAKLDSSGTLQWDTVFTVTGGQYYGQAWSIVSTQDGNIVVAGLLSVQLQVEHSFFVKLDLQGNVIWSKLLYNIQLYDSEPHSIRELNDGSFIVAGFRIVRPVHPYYGGFLLKLSSNGDSLWSHDYELTPNSAHRLEDVYPTPDGGFVACGVIFAQPPDTGHQDLWIIKVDSMGCEVANCTVGIDEITGLQQQMQVYPVPFSESLQVSVRQLSRNGNITVYNMQGQLTGKYSAESQVVNTSHWPEGLYLIQLDSEGIQETKKVMKVN